ncbi:MAG: hypothetical protein OEZ34_11310, partial [Spirochaetia bacterium]|nr:hypothetical protein [Spirochaetia bacterium]
MKNLQKKLFMFLFSSTFFVLTVLPFSKVHAQVTCTGSACSLMPLTPDQFNQMLWDFKFQYLDVLMDDMGKASVLSNMSGAPVGTVNLSGFSIGAGVSAGYVEDHKVNVVIANAGTLTDLPSAGGNIIPRAHFGFNLGKFFGLSYDPFGDNTNSKPSWYSPARFDIYLSGGKYKYSKSGEITYNFLNGMPVMNDSYGISSEYKGADFYYHIMEGKSFGGPLFGFLGLSAGLGVHDALISAEYFKVDSKT